MTPEEIQAVLDTLQFADWTFRYVEGTHKIFVTGHFPNWVPKYSGTEVIIDQSIVLPTPVTPDIVIWNAYLIVLWIMEHECREHFLVNGQKVYDPHARFLGSEAFTDQESLFIDTESVLIQTLRAHPTYRVNSQPPRPT